MREKGGQTKTLKLWKRYIVELFHDNKGEHSICKNRKEIVRLKSDVTTALIKMKSCKTTGADVIVIDILTILHNFEADNDTENDICNTSQHQNTGQPQ